MMKKKLRAKVIKLLFKLIFIKKDISVDAIDPIDQILATQENLLKDQRDQKLEDLAKMEIEKKKHKERLEKQEELKKKKKV